MNKNFTVSFTIELNGSEVLVKVEGSVEPPDYSAGLMSESVDIEAVYDEDTGALIPWPLLRASEKAEIERETGKALERRKRNR